MSTKEVKINENIAVNKPEFNEKYTTILMPKVSILMHYNMEIRNGYFQNIYKNFYKVEDNVPMKFLLLYLLLDYFLKNIQDLFQTLLLE